MRNGCRGRGENFTPSPQYRIGDVFGDGSVLIGGGDVVSSEDGRIFLAQKMGVTHVLNAAIEVHAACVQSHWRRAILNIATLFCFPHYEGRHPFIVSNGIPFSCTSPQSPSSCVSYSPQTTGITTWPCP